MTERNIPSQLSYESLLHSLYHVMYSREAPNDQVQFNVEQIVNHNISLDDIIRSFADSEERLEIERTRAIAGINSEIYDSQDLIFKRDVALFDRDGNIIPSFSNRLGSKYDLLLKIQNIANTRIFLDVGASIGQTMIEAFAFDRSVQYFGFEPNPAAFRYLKVTAEANALNANLFPWACSDVLQPLKLYALASLDTAATTRPDMRGNAYGEGDGRWVASYPIDYIKNFIALEDNFILKIDVEGAEFNVISGAQATIDRHRPFIICEILNAHSHNEIIINDDKKLNIESKLKELDYDIYQQIFAPDDFYGDRRLLGLRQLPEIPKSRTYGDFPSENDYVLVPKEFGDISFNA